MHEFNLKVFGAFKNLFQFLKIVDLFLIMLFLLYWTEHLLHANWGWMQVFRPLFEYLVSMGQAFNDGSLMLFAAVFEFKFFIAFVILLLIYGFIHLDYLFVGLLEKVYIAQHNMIKKIEEEKLNKNFAKIQTNEQLKLQRYFVYIGIEPKKESLSPINKEEQEKQMNKFLIGKTGVSPEKFDDGFLYNFTRFDYIDHVLDALFKVLNSEAPLDYQVIIMMHEDDLEKETERLRKLINLKFMNKISALSNVAYRYKFVKPPHYKTSLLGIFQGVNGGFEVHEFVE